MLLDKQFEKVLKKLAQIEVTYESLIFTPVDEVEMKLYVCKEHFRMPPDGTYCPIAVGETWGGSDLTGWFCGDYIVPKRLAGKNLYVCAETGALETMLFVDGMPKGIYANRIVESSRGNHHTLLLQANAETDDRLNIALEAYCWHNGVGTQPFGIPDMENKTAVYRGVHICLQDEEVKEFVFRLRILRQLQEFCEEEFYRAEIENCLWEVFKEVTQVPSERTETEWRGGIRAAIEKMSPLIQRKNSPDGPHVGLIGHSHMDTAWQWTIDETVRKCARTYSNALSLMEQYPQYLFFQSSAYHGEMMKENYPSLFAQMQRRVQEGRYEPNGGVWVECDCNLVSGESLIRQFLWGQRWTQENYGYTSDVFWLPDTFGYSAALPQILKGCGIKYFLTTKLMWNETNEFPYDTFWWRGIDGTQVFSHFNDIHCKPDPASILQNMHKRNKNKRVSNTRLLAYGFGDGGGGPSYDMVEMAQRVEDIYGCPKAKHTTVSHFMNELCETSKEAPVHSGELYLELHRGTLTSFHDIKKNNRKAEIALHDLDFANACAWQKGKPVADIAPLYRTVLINQFHDILPGTCIRQVNERAIREMQEVLENAKSAFEKVLKAFPSCNIGIVNTLSWKRDWGYLPAFCKLGQTITNVDGCELCYAEGLEAEGLAVTELHAAIVDGNAPSAFVYDGVMLETPFYNIKFAEDGALASVFDKIGEREIRSDNGIALNSFLLPEDVPQAWDNWDIDADLIETMHPVKNCLTKREVVANGPLQMRLRSTWKLTEKSTVVQDMVVYANRRQIDFETKVDWHERHKLLKVGFDFNINASNVRHEIQFGYTERAAYKNNCYEKAMFEVLNHKYTDISELRYGVAVLNDCKYGISVNGSQIALSLLKGGTHPDTAADEGVHVFTYSLLPHNGFSFENVIRPAYELNYPLHAIENVSSSKSLVTSNAPNVIVDTVKIAEDGDGLVLRLYESECVGTNVTLNFGEQVKAVFRTDLLEQNAQPLTINNSSVQFSIKAFEIITLKLKF